MFRGILDHQEQADILDSQELLVIPELVVYQGQVVTRVFPAQKDSLATQVLAERLD